MDRLLSVDLDAKTTFKMVSSSHDEAKPMSPNVGSATSGLLARKTTVQVPSPTLPAGALYPPASGKGVDFMAGETEWNDSMGQGDMVLELADGLALSGHSFGADKSISGECVFQTG